MPRNSKAKQEANLQVIVREHVLGGKTQGEVAKQLGVTRQTVNENLMGSGMTENITTVARAEAVSEMKQLRDEVLRHREGNKPLALAAIDRLIRIAEVVMRLEGTAAPTRSESVSLHADAQNIGPYRQFVLACSGLEQDQIGQLLVMARELPRRQRALPEPPDSSPLWGKQLEGNDANN
jgi:hypothetical protein